MQDFFTTTLTAIPVPSSDSILVICGGEYDARALRAAGYTKVTISNVDERQADFGFEWFYQDAEALTFPDGSFDWVIVNAGLHHCASPHRALLEMYRVCRKGALVIEARDSLLMRAAVRLGVTPEYEIDAVVIGGWETGGVRNSAIPNFIYRWTERDIRKTIESAWPEAVHRFRFFYGYRFPAARLEMSWLRFLRGLLNLAGYIAQLILPRQGNQFGAVILKTGELKPWMDASGIRMRRDYALGFDPARYRG